MIKETTWREQNDEFSTPVIIGSAICCFLLFSLIFSVLYCSKTSNACVRVLISTCARYFNKLAVRWSVSFRRFRYRLLCYVHRSFQLSLWFSCFFFFFFNTLFIVHRHADFVSIRVLTNVRACKSHLFVKRTGLHVYMHSGHDRYTRSRSDLSRTPITTPSSLTFKLCSRCDRSRFSLRTPINV